MRHFSYESAGAQSYESPPPLVDQRAVTQSGRRPALAVRVEPRVVALIAQYDSIIDRVAAEHGMDGNIVRGIIAAESGGRSNAGRGRGYKGLMQAGTDASQYDPERSITTGVRKFVQFRRTISRLLRREGIDISTVDRETMVRWVATSYNAGPGTVIRAVKYALAAGNAGNWMQAEHFQRALIYTGAYSITQAASSCLRGQQQQPGTADLITANRERVNLRGREIPLAQARATISPLLLCAIEFKHRNIPRYVERILTYMRDYDRRASPPARESFEFPVDGFGIRSSYENWQSGLNRPSAFARNQFGFEMNDQELEVGANRDSPGYIKWVQQSLNQILGLRLKVDGDRGPQTRHAIRSFQKQHGLKDDAIVGSKTEAALIAAGASPPPGASGWVPSTLDAPVQPDITSSAGFGNTPQSFALRVSIIGYASPLWKGAKSTTQADMLNYELSSKRAATVRAAVEKELRANLGNNIRIEYAASQMEPRNPQGIEIGSFGAGSRDALAAARGNRQANSAIDRKVEVMIEKITTTYPTGGVSLPPASLPGRTDSWALGVTKLRMIAVGLALGSIEIVLRNRLTNKFMYATANLYGGGIGAGVATAGGPKGQFMNATKNNLAQALSDFIGRGEQYFTTKNEMGFDDFEGEFIRIGKASAACGVKSTFAYAVLPSIRHHPEMLVFESKVGLTLPTLKNPCGLEGWVASGKLHLRGPNPGDDWEDDRSGQVHGSYDKHWQETLVLTFPTGKWELQPTDKLRLTEFVAIWSRRYLAPD